MQITIIEIQIVDGIDGQPYCRLAEITISNGVKKYTWSVGGIPLDGDAQAYLDGIVDDIWRDAEARGGVPQTEITYVLPIRTPALYADDVYVSSRDIKDNPDEAFAEAIAETEKAKGKPKSLDLISRSTLKAVEKAREEIGDLKQKIKTMEDDIKDLKKKIK